MFWSSGTDMDFTWYDAGLFGLFVCAVAVVSCRVNSTQKGESEDYSTFRAWKRVMSLIIPQSPRFVLTLTAAITESVCSTLTPVCMGSIVDLISAISLKGDKDVNEVINAMAYISVSIICLDVIKCIAVYGRECLNNNLGDFARQKAQVLVVCFCKGGVSSLDSTAR